MKLHARLAGLALPLLLLAPSGEEFSVVPEGYGAGQEAPTWAAFRIEDVRSARSEHGRPWQEFIRSPDLFAGLYEIPAGGEDSQRPHDADEVYYVMSGRATLLVDGERTEAAPGSVIFVAKEKEHRFVEITEDLSVLVFFATPGRSSDPEG